MPPKCPECQRFMVLVPFEEVGKDPWDCYQWWYCPNENNHYFRVDPIPAPEYQWLWDCMGIPFDVLTDWPELFAEYAELWERLPKRYKREYREQNPDEVRKWMGGMQNV